MGCSTIRSDAETVRSFLDKGAHPNWKDAAGRTAFDLIIFSHNVCYFLKCFYFYYF
jgi:hypothetical protein